MNILRTSISDTNPLTSSATLREPLPRVSLSTPHSRLQTFKEQARERHTQNNTMICALDQAHPTREGRAPARPKFCLDSDSKHDDGRIVVAEVIRRSELCLDSEQGRGETSFPAANGTDGRAPGFAGRKDSCAGRAARSPTRRANAARCWDKRKGPSASTGG
jgi:hypothetical protein